MYPVSEPQTRRRLLYGILTDGPIWAIEAIRLAAQAGIAKRTLDRAKRVLGVVSRKWGSGRNSRWSWQLPGDLKRLQPFKELDLDDLMDRLLCGADEPSLPRDGPENDHQADDRQVSGETTRTTKMTTRDSFRCDSRTSAEE